MVYQKLLALQSATRSLAADAQGQTGAAHYNFISGSKLLGVIRPKMDELGLLLLQEIVDITNTPISYQTRSGEKTEMFTSLKLKFTWVDSEDGSKVEQLFCANGMNAWDKGLGSALTYAERYFLLKTLHIATDEDDVDALVKDEAIKATTPVVSTPTPTLAEVAPVQSSLVSALADAQNAKTTEQLMAVWNKWKPELGKNVDFVRAISVHPANPKKGRTNA